MKNHHNEPDPQGQARYLRQLGRRLKHIFSPDEIPRQPSQMTRRHFLKGAVALSLAPLAHACADNYVELTPGLCSREEIAGSCSYRDGTSARCSIWNGGTIELDGILFKVSGIRWEEGTLIADVNALIMEENCSSLFPSPVPAEVPGTAIISVRDRGYYVTIYNAHVAEDPRFSWADVEVRRFYTYCEMDTVTKVLSLDGTEGADTIASRDGNITLKFLGVDPEGRAILQALDSSGAPQALLAMHEGEVRYGQVGDKVYPVTAHIVVAGNGDLVACAEISISTCSELPHGTGLGFHW